MRSLRIPLVAALAAAAAMAAAGAYTIRLVPFPAVVVADGHSQISVSAQVFDDGKLAADGTQVVFETNLGSFRESVVRTSGGQAQGLLVAGGVPGTARIKASIVAGNATGSTCEVEFVKSREDLSAARETIEATSTGSLVYANDSKILEGVAPDKGVAVRYRDYEIHADVVQIDLGSFVLKARKATVRRGRRTTTYDSIVVNLAERTGFGLTNYPASRPDSLVAYPGGVAFVESGGGDGEPVVAPARMRFGMVELGHERDRPLSVPLEQDPFAMADISESPSTVGAKKAVVFARREIQFHRADIYVNNAKVLRFPLFVVNLNSNSGSPLVTDDLLSINDNQISLNYPHYLTLKPGLTSLLRFHTGERYGQNLTASRGAFLDYELAWSKSDDAQGSFTFSGMGRTDWVATLQQNLHIDDRSSASFQLSSPGGRSVSGSGGIGRTFGSYNLSLSGSQNQTLTGPRLGRYSSQYYGLNFDRNPIRIPGTHVRTSYGLTASQSSTTSPLNGVQQTDSTSGVGFAARAFTDSLTIDKMSSVNASFGATQLYGPNARLNHGLALNGSVSYTRRLNNAATGYLTYNYIQDGLNERILGRNSLSLIGNYSKGPAGLRVAANKGIGVERLSLTGEASYRLSGLWRVSYTHFLNTYPYGDGAVRSFTEYFAILSYRIGWREVGLTWSSRTHRPGLQLMNVNF